MCVLAAWQVIRLPMRTRREDVFSQIKSSSHSLALVFCSIVYSFPLDFLPTRYAVSIIILVYICSFLLVFMATIRRRIVTLVSLCLIFCQV